MCMSSKKPLIIFLFVEIFLILVGLLGVNAGAHRLWAHRSYGANAFLRTLLMLFHTVTLTGSIYDWVLDHRIHHKYRGTDDDPYNYKRGFFYAHIGHRMQTGNPRRDEIVKEIDMSDIEADRIVMFQKKYCLMFNLQFKLFKNKIGSTG